MMMMTTTVTKLVYQHLQQRKRNRKQRQPPSQITFLVLGFAAALTMLVCKHNYVVSGSYVLPYYFLKIQPVQQRTFTTANCNFISITTSFQQQLHQRLQTRQPQVTPIQKLSSSSSSLSFSRKTQYILSPYYYNQKQNGIKPRTTNLQSNRINGINRNDVNDNEHDQQPSQQSMLLKRTADQLQRLKEQEQPTVFAAGTDENNNNNNSNNNNIETMVRYKQYLAQSADSLKRQLKDRQLHTKGRKPDLAMRLAQHDNSFTFYNTNNNNDVPSLEVNDDLILIDDRSSIAPPLTITNGGTFGFAGINELSNRAMMALTQWKILTNGPTPIQSVSIPKIVAGESCIIHSETGSGKTLAYLLPITEQLWNNQQQLQSSSETTNYAVIMTPTRELAIQVATVAMSLSPPGCVKYVSQPSNLFKLPSIENNDRTNTNKPGLILYVGSAKTIHTSLYGDTKLPAPPTPKPLAMSFLQNVQYIVLDEVDRLLLGTTASTSLVMGSSKNNKRTTTNNSKKHEKPAAIVTAACVRLSWGTVQIVAASATIGRPLTRELARVLGLPPKECPQVLRPQLQSPLVNSNDDRSSTITSTTTNAVGQYNPNNSASQFSIRSSTSTSSSIQRAVTLPSTVQNYIVPVFYGSGSSSTSSTAKDDDNNSEGSNTYQYPSPGMVLTKAYQVIKALNTANNNNNMTCTNKILLVITRNFGISIQNVLGALRHFQCHPYPQSLTDVLESDIDSNTDNKFEKNRRSMQNIRQQLVVSKKQSKQQKPSNGNIDNEDDDEEGYVLVTNEDTVRGLDLDGLDVVVVAGRPNTVDEYVHIAGRTGRAGKSGIVITIVPELQQQPQQAQEVITTTSSSSPITFISSWEKMLNTTFVRVVDPANLLMEISTATIKTIPIRMTEQTQ